MKNTILLILLGLLCGMCPPSLMASEKLAMQITLPTLDPQGQPQLRKYTMVTAYSLDESRIAALGWDPCKHQMRPTDCPAINLLHATGIQFNPLLYGKKTASNPQGCHIEIDLSQYHPLSTGPALARQSIPHRDLLLLALQSLNRNTAGHSVFSKCALTYKGLDTTTIKHMNLPLQLDASS